MKYLLIPCFVLTLTTSMLAEKISLKDQKAKVSYGIGLDIGNKMKSQNIEVDPSILAEGLRDALKGNKPQLSEEEIRTAMTAFEKEMRAKTAQASTQAAQKNTKEGEAFLAENKKKEGVKTLPSGLQYKVITEGKGKTPKESDSVTTHYRGTLIDGTEFDSSYKRGEPATFPVKGVIPGWTEALQLMKEGSKWQLIIPPNLAYGEQGAPQGKIGPNAVLLFDIELISVNKPS